jgi:hypothetical protein
LCWQKRRPPVRRDILQQLAPLADGTFLQFLRFGCMGAVLLVEDHDEVHRVLCDLIKHAGHKTDCVKTIGEALALLAPRLSSTCHR